MEYSCHAITVVRVSSIRLTNGSFAAICYLQRYYDFMSKYYYELILQSK